MYFSFLPHFLIGKRRRKGEQERGNVESGDGMYNLLFARFVFRKKGKSSNGILYLYMIFALGYDTKLH